MKPFLILPAMLIMYSCITEKEAGTLPAVIETKIPDTSLVLEIEFTKGKSYNYPSFAFWIEDLEGNYKETIYVTRFVASGVYGHGSAGAGRWKKEAGEARRPASLPYWSHKRGVVAPDGLYIPSPSTPVPDALTSATPRGSFLLKTGTTLKPESKFRVLMEINQAWDSNAFWNNSKYEGDMDYFISLQPSLVYAVTIDPSAGEKEYFFNPAGHGHPSGKDGRLFTDLTTITTAEKIADRIVVRIK